MRILFCGDRNWTDVIPIQRAFDNHEVSVVIHGGASGADTLAEREAKLRGIPVERFNADWKNQGRAAGPIRNRKMIEEGKPDLVIAFHSNISESKGTANMIKQANKHKIPVKLIV